MTKNPDPLDQANELAESERESSINKARQAVANMDKGEEGECIECGEYFSRIVKGKCARCRDGRY